MLGVEQRDAERVEPDELRRTQGKRGEHVLDRMPSREQPGDLAERGREARSPVALAEMVESRPELVREIGR